MKSKCENIHLTSKETFLKRKYMSRCKKKKNLYCQFPVKRNVRLMIATSQNIIKKSLVAK